MGDVFNEQIVKRHGTFSDTIKRVGITVLVLVIFLVSFIFIQTLAVFIGAAAVFGAIYLMSFLNVEYEYVYTNGELDIDIIYNRARRKRLFSTVVKDFEIMAHVEDKTHMGAFGNAQETINCHSGEIGPQTYAFLATIKGKKAKVVFESNDKMLKAIGTSLSRRKLHLRPGTVMVGEANANAR